MTVNEDAAVALSTHRFDEAYPFIATDVDWAIVGAGVVRGRDDLIEACQTLATELVGTAVTFDRVRSIASVQSVVVDTVATYEDANGDRSMVASCDIYDFAAGLIVAIRSFNVELDAETPDSAGS